ncbi:hypothetical protein WICMUC_004731 [Wickerhamomyces mucosus]|uniref:mitochondrial processing peptidase n=1 Tax=Wickerhamomyces mucosus TaxID=1378264 RepID=A0A9P8PGY2_9ASCO|nr:hypothetical protein WICMUC_004731 [Wickerhamomyces mucosus]
MLRSINNFTVLRRNLATALQSTKVTQLPNGLTVASEAIPNISTATVGIWIDAGSRAENILNNGTAHFLEHLAFKGTKTRTQLSLELEIENLGAHLNAYTSRENTVYYAKCVEQDIPKAINVLSDILTRSTLEPKAIERERDVIIRESEEVDTMYDEVVFDHLHDICYKNQPLGRTILGPIENIKKIQREDLTSYIEKNYSSDRMVLVGAGAVDHSELEKFAQENFGHLTPSNKAPLKLGTPRGELPKFFGAEKKTQNLTIPTNHIAIAFEGVSWNSPDYFTALVTQSIIGSWDRSLGTGSNSPSKLALAVSNNGQPLANSYMSFTTSYADTGLWGVYLTSEQGTDLKSVTFQIVDEWKRLIEGEISEQEVLRAKQQLKASLLLSLDGSTAIAEDIGRQIVTTGERLSPEQVFENIDLVQLKDVQNWCIYRLKSKPVSIAALGDVESLPPIKEITKRLE